MNLTKEVIKMKKIFIVLLSVLAICFFSTENFEASEIVDSGKCGDNLKYELFEDGELVISGTGKMWDSPQWESYGDTIISVKVGDGVTSISADAFNDCDSLKNYHLQRH